LWTWERSDPGIGISQAAKSKTATSFWPLVEENANVAPWAAEFLQAGYGSMTA
jgi:hypothetical protein